MENKLILFGIFYALLHAMSTKGADLHSSGNDIESFSSSAKLIDGKQSLIDDELNNFRMQKCFQKIEALEKRMTAEAKESEERWNQRMTTEAKETEEKWKQRMAAETHAIEEIWKDEIFRMSLTIEKLEERMTTEAKETEERWSQRMAVETHAIEERWSQRMSEKIKATEGRMSAEIRRLNQKVDELSNQLAKSRYVATSQKRPAELACEKITKDLRSIEGIKFSHILRRYFYLYTSDRLFINCEGTLIDKRFFITAADRLGSSNYTEAFFNNTWLKVKTVHIHPDFSSERAYLNNIALIELESDVHYTRKMYPVCLHTSPANPESDLIGVYGKVQIVADAECFNKTVTDLKSSQICTKSSENSTALSGMPMYEVQKNVPKYKLFGIVATDSDKFEPLVITKVFDHLDYIESIVWSKNGN